MCVGGMFLCAKGHPFLELWLRKYIDDYRVRTWGYIMTTVTPTKLIEQNRNLVHVESKSFHRPNWVEVGKYVKPKRFDWQTNFIIHLWNSSPRWKREAGKTANNIIADKYHE